MPTIEQLEGEAWGEPEADTYLVRTFHALRKKDIAEFTIEDLRIMIGQGVALEHLAPAAMAALERDPFVAGDYFPGDLLSALLRPENRGPMLMSLSGLESVCSRALAQLEGAEGEVLRDGRFIGDHVARQLTAQIHDVLAWLSKA